MAQLDNEMRSVLDRNGTSQDEKAKLCGQILENYLHSKGKQNIESKNPIPVTFAGDAVNRTEVTSSMSASVPSTREVISKAQSICDIVQVLPKTLQSKAEKILKRIQDNPQVLSWNDKGELKYQGETMPNTNITNLVSDSLKNRKRNNKPNGFEVFTKGLQEINLPEDLIRNPERLQLFRAYGYEKTQMNKSPSISQGKTTPKKKKTQWLTNF